MTNETAAEPTCSFCYAPADKVDVLVASPFAHICDKCIALSSEIVQEHCIRKLIKQIQNEDKQDASSS